MNVHVDLEAKSANGVPLQDMMSDKLKFELGLISELPPPQKEEQKKVEAVEEEEEIYIDDDEDKGIARVFAYRECVGEVDEYGIPIVVEDAVEVKQGNSSAPESGRQSEATTNPAAGGSEI